MDFNFIWQAILIVLIGTFLLRIAGRKTISEMTLAETVLMISIGTLIIQPVTSKSVWKSFLVGLVLVLTLLVLEYAQLKSNRTEKIITGKPKVVIEDGVINNQELLRLHLTVDQLEMQLRLNKVVSVSDVKVATLEPSGRLGIMLKKEAQPATKKDIQQLQKSIDQLLVSLNNAPTQQENDQSQNSKPNKVNLFFEIKNSEQHKNR